MPDWPPRAPPATRTRYKRSPSPNTPENMWRRSETRRPAPFPQSMNNRYTQGNMEIVDEYPCGAEKPSAARLARPHPSRPSTSPRWFPYSATLIWTYRTRRTERRGGEAIGIGGSRSWRETAQGRQQRGRQHEANHGLFHGCSFSPYPLHQSGNRGGNFLAVAGGHGDRRRLQGPVGFQQIDAPHVAQGGYGGHRDQAPILKAQQAQEP